MSRDASIDLDWADGTHRFRLPIGQLQELQDKSGASLFVMHRRLVAHEPMIADVRETLRLGLIGGGAAPPAALSLVRRYVDERPLVENILPALAVLAAALLGVPDEEPGKAGATAAEPPASPPTDD